MLFIILLWPYYNTHYNNNNIIIIVLLNTTHYMHLHYDITTKKLDLIGNQKKILPRYVEYSSSILFIIFIIINILL